MTAHQRTIRDNRASEGSDADMFGNWWNGINIDIKLAEIRPISYQTAEAIISKYEWLGTMPGKTLFQFGIFFEGACAGAVIYAPDYGENLGIWDKYGFTGKIICLARGACVHWAHPHSASKLIKQSIKLLPERYRVVTATVDERAGEIGTIYQACGFEFVGKMSKSKIAFKIGDRIVSERRFRHRHIGKRWYGTAEFEQVQTPGKGRYFYFRGPAGEKKKYRRAIEHLIKPYPKRAEQVSSRDTDGTPIKAGGSSPAPLQFPVHVETK